MRDCKEANTLDVATSTFLILDTPIFILIYLMSTLSYLCNDVLIDKEWNLADIDFDIMVSNLLLNCVKVNKVYKDVQMVIGKTTFLVDLLKLKYGEDMMLLMGLNLTYLLWIIWSIFDIILW